MPAVERKTEHVKILQDLGYDPWEIENDDDMLSVLKASINDLSRENPSDGRIPLLQGAVRGLRKPKFKEKKTTIKGDKFMGKEPKKKDAPITDKSKLLSGVGKFSADDIKSNIKPEAEQGDDIKSDIKPEAEIGEDQDKLDKIIKFLNADVKDKLDEINQSAIEIKDILVTQGDLADERDEALRQSILSDRKKEREKNLEKKKGVKEKMLDSVTKPVGNFLNKLIKFVMMTFVGSVVNRLLTLLKDPAQFLDPIKRFFNFIIGMVNAVMKGLWNITGAPINFIINGINKGVSSLLDSINKATGLLKIPPIEAPEIPLIPGPPKFEFIPLSKTAQAKNEEAVGMSGGGLVPGDDGIDGAEGKKGGEGLDGKEVIGKDGKEVIGKDGKDGKEVIGKDGKDGTAVGMAGGGVVPGSFENITNTETSTPTKNSSDPFSFGKKFVSPEEAKERVAAMGMPSMELMDGTVVPDFGKMGGESVTQGLQLTRDIMVQNEAPPERIAKVDELMAMPDAQPESIATKINQIVPGSMENTMMNVAADISAKAKMSGGGIVRNLNVRRQGFGGGGYAAPYPTTNLLGMGHNVIDTAPENIMGYNKGGKVIRYNKGGKVPGRGEGDTVPAMLTPGEFVMSKGAVDQIGADKLMAMNKAGGGTNQPKLMKFAGGGIVPDIPTPNKKGGGVVVIGGGGGSQAPRGVQSSGDSGTPTPQFSSTDPNNITIPVVKSLYNIMS